jgi:NADPH:quinone reductase-like Zn-dependent oxidoreductase
MGLPAGRRAADRANAGTNLSLVKAVTYLEYGGPEVLHVADVEEPHPGAGQVRVAVRAACVNPIDWKMRSGAMRDVMPVSFPAIDGREAAGVVDELGPEVTRVAVGDEVFGFTVGGAAAERAILDDFAHKPASLSWEAAAGLPVAAETSVRVFTVLGGVNGRQTLVINGAAGGVGAVAVQLARARGARVIGTASEPNHEFLRSLGAEPTTYGQGLVERVRALTPGGVDLAFDTAGKGGIADLITLTGDPARVATIADFSAADLGVKVTGGNSRSAGALDEAAALAEAGRLHVAITRTFTFAEAADAHRISQDGHVRGKLVLIPD